MAAPKEKYYFGCVPKDQLDKFLQTLSKGIKEGKKSGDKKEFELEIRGSEKDPEGISFENFTYDKTRFNEFFDPSQEYMKKALVACTLNIEVKEEKDVEALKKVYEKAKPIFDAIPQIKEKPGKYELQFRSSGKKVAVDLISTEGKLVQPLLDLGVDLSEYHKFNFALKSGVDLSKLFADKPDVKQLADVFSILLSVKSTGENVKYLAGALSEAIKVVELKDEKLKKKKEKVVGFLNLINAFIGAKIKLQYDSKVLAGEGEKAAEKHAGGAAGLQAQLTQYQQMVKMMGPQLVKPHLEALGAVEPLKSTNIDAISISVGVPKYQNGFAVVIKIPGLSKVVGDLLA
jgi:hypothetical protein